MTSVIGEWGEYEGKNKGLEGLYQVRRSFLEYLL